MKNRNKKSLLFFKTNVAELNNDLLLKIVGGVDTDGNGDTHPTDKEDGGGIDTGLFCNPITDEPG